MSACRMRGGQQVHHSFSEKRGRRVVTNRMLCLMGLRIQTTFKPYGTKTPAINSHQLGYV